MSDLLNSAAVFSASLDHTVLLLVLTGTNMITRSIPVYDATIYA